jgi:TatD DNase family protein
MIDIGLNLASSQFDADRDAVVERALAQGVRAFLLTGTSAKSSAQVERLAAGRPDIFRATAGVHPHQASAWDAAVSREIARLAGSSRVAAVGECGLDYDRGFSSPGEQKRAFSEQLDLALRVGKPAFLHLRPGPDEKLALDDFEAIARPFAEQGGRGVVHCFTSSEQALRLILDLGLSVGVTGWICDERRGAALAALAPSIPADRLHLETDAPYLTPRTMPGGKRVRRNEPAFLPFVAQELARLRGESSEELSRRCAQNAARLFAWPELVADDLPPEPSCAPDSPAQPSAARRLG